MGAGGRYYLGGANEVCKVGARLYLLTGLTCYGARLIACGPSVSRWTRRVMNLMVRSIPDPAYRKAKARAGINGGVRQAKDGAELGRPERSLSRGGGRASKAIRDERVRDRPGYGRGRRVGGKLGLHVSRRGLFCRASRLRRDAGMLLSGLAASSALVIGGVTAAFWRPPWSRWRRPRSPTPSCLTPIGIGGDLIVFATVAGIFLSYMIDHA